MMMLWPWEHREKPFMVDEEKNVEWYIDKSLTDYARKPQVNGSRPLDNVTAFILRKDGKVSDRVLVNDRRQVLHISDYDMIGLSSMATKIDILRLALTFDDHGVQL